VIETNPAGTSSAASDHTKFTVAVPAPTITNIVDAVGHQGTVPEGGMTNDNHPTISGTGTPGALIQIYQNGDGCGGVYVDSTGHWSLTITGPMSNGSHKMTAKQIVSGQTSADSNGWTITIDTSVPAMPEITSVVDNVGSITGAIKLNGMTDDARPVVNGTGKAGDNIKLYDGSTLIGTATVGADGKWSIRPSNALSNALHDLTATDTNVAGTVSPASQHFTFTVNTATPATPDAPTVTDNGSWVPPGGTMPDGHPVISNTSTGTSGDVITIYDNGNRIGSTTIGSDGKWSFKPSTDLSSGLHNITVTETNPAGTSSAMSNASTVIVNPIPQETVTITQLMDDSSGSQVAIPQNGSTSDTTPIVKGTVTSQLAAGESLVVYRDGAKVGTATMNGTSWSFNDSGVGVGQHTYTAQVENTSGHGPVSNSYTFNESRATVGQIMGRNGDGIYIDVGNCNAGYIEIEVGGMPGMFDMTAHRTGANVKIVEVAPGLLYVAIGGNSTLFFGVDFSTADGTRTPLVRTQINLLFAKSDQWQPFNAGQIPAAGFKSVLHSAAAPDDAGSVAATEQQHTQDTVALPSHTVVGEHDTFKAAASGNATVDLNADPASYFKEATAHIEGAKGGAVDTLHLMGDHQILDLTSLTGKTAAAKVSGIEVIDLGGQHNTLKLSLVDVLNLGETDLFQQDGKQQLMVNGKEGDVVDLSNSHIAGLAEGEWQQHGTTQVGGVTYNVYEHSSAHTELLVEQAVRVEVH
jgi:large repetitive protein